MRLDHDLGGNKKLRSDYDRWGKIKQNAFSRVIIHNDKKKIWRVFFFFRFFFLVATFTATRRAARHEGLDGTGSGTILPAMRSAPSVCRLPCVSCSRSSFFHRRVESTCVFFFAPERYFRNNRFRRTLSVRVKPTSKCLSS